MKKTIISLLFGLVIISIGGIVFWYSSQESIDTTIPDCDPVLDAPVVVINDIPKTCHISEILWWTIPEGLWGDDSAVGNNAIYSGYIYWTSDDQEYWSWFCRRGEYIFQKVKDQDSYTFLRKYLKNNLLSIYGIGWLGYNLLSIWPSTYYESRDTYETVNDNTRDTLYALGYQEGYQNLQDYQNDRPIFTFRNKLYDPFYKWVDQYSHEKIDQNAEMQIVWEEKTTYSSPWKITWFENEKLVFVRQTDITIKRDKDGKAIYLDSWDTQHKEDKYGEHDHGYIVSYNIETCTEN